MTRVLQRDILRSMHFKQLSSPAVSISLICLITLGSMTHADEPSSKIATTYPYHPQKTLPRPTPLPSFPYTIPSDQLAKHDQDIVFALDSENFSEDFEEFLSKRYQRSIKKHKIVKFRLLIKKDSSTHHYYAATPYWRTEKGAYRIGVAIFLENGTSISQLWDYHLASPQEAAEDAPLFQAQTMRHGRFEHSLSIEKVDDNQLKFSYVNKQVVYDDKELYSVDFTLPSEDVIFSKLKPASSTD